MAEVAIAWALKKGVTPICGLNSQMRIDEAVSAVKIKLTEEEVLKIDSPYIAKAVTGF
jgi:aryl-alcohol dehydrogenase-like predicted oxidoreductase